MISLNNLKVLVFSILIFQLFACSAKPAFDHSAPKSDDGLTRVSDTASDIVYLNSEADFKQFDNIVIKPLIVDNIRIAQPEDLSSKRDVWKLQAKDIELLQSLYQKNMVEELAKSGRYTINRDSAEKTLIISAQIIALHPNAPKDDSRSRYVQSTYISDGAGSMTIAFALVDAQAKTTIARAVDTYVDKGWQENNSLTNRMAINTAFNRWARRMKNVLIQLSAPATN